MTCHSALYFCEGRFQRRKLAPRTTTVQLRPPALGWCSTLLSRIDHIATSSSFQRCNLGFSKYCRSGKLFKLTGGGRGGRGGWREGKGCRALTCCAFASSTASTSHRASSTLPSVPGNGLNMFSIWSCEPSTVAMKGTTTRTPSVANDAEARVTMELLLHPAYRMAYAPGRPVELGDVCGKRRNCEKKLTAQNFYSYLDRPTLLAFLEIVLFGRANCLD